MTTILERYKEIVGPSIIDELCQIAEILHGIKIVHLNSTRSGGGVAEILSTMVQLSNALGVESRWETMQGSAEFFRVTKSFHNALQGKKQTVLEPSHYETYERVNAENAEQLRSVIENADVVFVHDPQPAALINSFPQRKNKWVWRCHIALLSPKRSVWHYLREFVSLFDASIFSLKDYVEPLSHVSYVIPPSIDPLSEKNIELPHEEIAAIFSQFSIDPQRPMILQVSRFDFFKDPVGVIQAYRATKKFKSGLQLVLAGGGATDDPESDMVLEEVRRAAGSDPDIHVLFLPEGSHRLINGLQRSADIILQKSIIEGFGLTVSEALWKKKPVIGGNTGGIRLQVCEGYTGFLVNSPEGAALRLRYLLQNPKLQRTLGEQGHRFVRENFLIIRHLRDYFAVIISLLHPGGRVELGKLSRSS